MLALFKTTKRLTLADVEWAIETYASFMREHMAREERVVLPAAEFHLTEADWQEIHAAFSENADPRFGGETEAEYRRLFSRIVNLAARKTSSRG